MSTNHYTIKSIKKNDNIIHEQLDNNDISLAYKVFNKHFKMPYANTCDSVQGLSIDNKKLSSIVILHMLIDISFGQH